MLSVLCGDEEGRKFYADFRVRLPGVRTRLRSAGLRPGEGTVPKVPEQKAGSPTLDLRRLDQGQQRKCTQNSALRFVRRSEWPRGLQPPRLQLTSRSSLCDFCGPSLRPLRFKILSLNNRCGSRLLGIKIFSAHATPPAVSKRDQSSLRPATPSMYNSRPAQLRIAGNLET